MGSYEFNATAVTPSDFVAFSCKRRGFCGSCGARRMAESAALLVDEVFPAQPVRQWVLSFPYPLRFLFASRPAVMSKVLGIVYRFRQRPAGSLPPMAASTMLCSLRACTAPVRGGGDCGSTYQSAINTAIANGTSVVVSAGNSNADAANFRPANCNDVITVAASDLNENRVTDSNYGSTVEITAPGGDYKVDARVAVASTLNDGLTTQTTDGYYYYQGTSMSAPHISGLVALMLDVDPALTPTEVSQALPGQRAATGRQLRWRLRCGYRRRGGHVAGAC